MNNPAASCDNRTWLNAFVLLVMLVSALMCTGCNIVAPISYLVTGPDKTPPVYTLPTNKLLVFVDDRQNIIPRTALKREIAMTVTNQLYKEAKVVPDAVNPDIIQKILGQEQNGQVMGITQVGEAAGAQTVLYIDVTGFSVVKNAEPLPTADFNIQVIDVPTRKCIWPPQSEGGVYMFEAQTHHKEMTDYATADKVDQLEKMLADFAGVRIAQLFYAHEKDPLDGRLEQ